MCEGGERTVSREIGKRITGCEEVVERRGIAYRLVRTFCRDDRHRMPAPASADRSDGAAEESPDDFPRSASHQPNCVVVALLLALRLPLLKLTFRRWTHWGVLPSHLRGMQRRKPVRPRRLYRVENEWPVDAAGTRSRFNIVIRRLRAEYPPQPFGKKEESCDGPMVAKAHSD